MLAAIAAIMDHSEASARARTRTIPDGTYEAESYMDDDGVEIGKRVPIRVKVIVEDDEMTIDLTEVSQPGARLLQFRHHHRPCLHPGRLQMHHLADRLSDQ